MFFVTLMGCHLVWGRFALIHQKNILKISIINPTYPYVYECIVKILYYSSEDGNKNLTTILYEELFIFPLVSKKE